MNMKSKFAQMMAANIVAVAEAEVSIHWAKENRGNIHSVNLEDAAIAKKKKAEASIAQILQQPGAWEKGTV